MEKEDVEIVEIIPSKIQEKVKAKFGAVLTTGRTKIAIWSVILSTLALLGLNASSIAFQNIPGLFGSWGAIFGNGIGPAVSGILGVGATTLGIGAVTLGASLIPNAIRHLSKNKEYESFLDPNLTNEQSEKIRLGELDYEAVVTENLINKINGRSDTKSSAFDQAKEYREQYLETKNPVYASKARYYEQMVNRATVQLIKRLNDLSEEKTRLFKIMNNPKVAVTKKKETEVTLNAKIIPEMKQIQVFLAEILDKSVEGDNRDPYYACVKHYLKKYHKTIELVTLPSNNEALSNELKNVITDRLVAGNVDDAIKNFCTYSREIIALGGKTDLNETFDANTILRTAADAGVLAEKFAEKARTAALGAELEWDKTKEIRTQIEVYREQILGIRDRAEKIEDALIKKYEFSKKQIEDIQRDLEEIAKIKNDYLNLFDELLQNSKLATKYTKQIKGILTNSTKDRTYIKRAKKDIKNLLEQANAYQLFDDLERLIDLVFMTESTNAIMQANLAESKKYLNKTKTISGRAANALGETRNSARIAHSYSNDAEESAKKAGKSANDAEASARHAKSAENRAEGNVGSTDSIIRDMMKHLKTTKESAETAGIESGRAKTFADDAEESAKGAKQARRNAERDARAIAFIKNNLIVVGDIVGKLQTITNDINNFKSELSIALTAIAEIKDEQATMDRKINKVANDAGMDVEACYEFLGREIESLFAHLRTQADSIDGLKTKIYQEINTISKNYENLSKQIKTTNSNLKKVNSRVTTIENYQKTLIENTLHKYGIVDTKLITEIHVRIKNIQKANNNKTISDNDIKKIIDDYLKEKKVVSTKTPEERKEAKEKKDARDARLDVLRVYAVTINECLSKKKTCPVSENDLETSSTVSISDTIEKIAKKGIKFTEDSQFVKNLYKLLAKYISKEVADKYAKRTLEYSSKMTVEEVNQFINYIEQACKEHNRTLAPHGVS